MKHFCDKCGKSVKEVGKVFVLNAKGAVRKEAHAPTELRFCKRCRDRMGRMSV